VHAMRVRDWVCLIVCVIVFAVSSPSPLSAIPTTGSPPAPPLRLVGDKDYPPLTYLDSGIAKGLDVDIARAVAARLGRDVRIDLMEWSEAQRQVLRGNADGLLSMSVSDERRLLYDFTEPTLTREFGWYVRRGEAALPGTADVLSRRVGVTPGGYPRQFLEARGANQLVLIANYDDGMRRVAAGTLDAVAADSWVAAHVIEGHEIRGIRLTGVPFAALAGGMAFRKGSGAPIPEIDDAIRRMKTDGTLAAIQVRWRPDEVVFVTEGRLRRIVQITGSVLLLLSVTATGAWAYGNRRQTRARQRVQSALAESQHRLQMALSAAEMGTWRWVPSTNEGTRDSNLNRMLGLDAVESTQPVSDFLDRVHHDDRAPLQADLERAIRERNTCAIDFRVVRPDGTVRWLRVKGRPYFNSAGELSYLTGAAIDITERRQIDQRAHLLAHALRSANDCITITDTNERLIYVNDAFLRTYGYTEDEIIGQHVSILRAADADTSIVKALSETNAADGWRGEFWNKSKTGRVFPVSLAASMVRDERGRVVAVVGVARDETARNELESQLRQAQKMEAIGRLAAGVAHDFNNLIMVILASCEDGSATPGLPPSIMQLFDDVRAAAESAASLTGQLMTFSRGDVGQPSVINWNDVIVQARRMIDRLVTSGIDLQVRCEPELGHVVADGVQLQQVLINLVVNARDAMPNGGQLVVETKNVNVDHTDLTQPRVPPGRYVLLAVTDTGRGMDQDTLARAFEPFFTTKAAGKGMGLGLSTVYGIVKQSGGMIWADSAPGCGTTVTIYLPRT
jgi:PAS domain S-box-containing protein